MTCRVSSALNSSHVIRTFLLAILGLSAAVNSSFAKDAYWREKVKSFTCTGITTEPEEKKDNDPVYRIDVLLEVDGHNRIVSISVTHMTVFGRTFQRTDQYPIEKIQNLEAPQDIMWTGRYRKDPSIVLYSMIDQTPNSNLWFYHEGQFKNDKQLMNLVAGCSAI